MEDPSLLELAVEGLGDLLTQGTVAQILLVGIVGALFFVVITGVRKFVR